MERENSQMFEERTDSLQDGSAVSGESRQQFRELGEQVGTAWWRRPDARSPLISESPGEASSLFSPGLPHRARGRGTQNDQWTCIDRS